MAETFEPGNRVEQSGIYRAVHAHCHTDDHEVICLRGNIFPPCRQCGEGVQFILVHPADDINSQRYFRNVNGAPQWRREAG
jgi:hypothetical protein